MKKDWLLWLVVCASALAAHTACTSSDDSEPALTFGNVTSESPHTETPKLLQNSDAPLEEVIGPSGVKLYFQSEAAVPGNPVATCKNAVRFFSLGNTGFNTSSVSATKNAIELGTAIGKHCAKHGCDFGMLLGDTIFPSGARSPYDPAWETQLNQPFGYAMRRVPLWHIMGNNDYGNHEDAAKPEHAFPYVGHVSVDAQWRMPATAYGFTVPGKEFVEFYAVDSTQMISGKLEHQVDKIRKLQKAGRPRFRLIFFHHPMHSNEKEFVTDAGILSGYKKLACGPGMTDALISGADHSMQWFQRWEACPIININTGAGSKHTPLISPQKAPTLYQNTTLPGFLYVVIGCGYFHGEFVDATGKIRFEHNVEYPSLK